MGAGAASFLLPHVNHVMLYGFLLLCSLLLCSFTVSLSALLHDTYTALSRAEAGTVLCALAA